MLSHEERVARAKEMLRQIAGNPEAESLIEKVHGQGLEAIRAPEAMHQPLRTAMEKVSSKASMDPQELFGLEAIVLPNLRPVVFINDGVYEPLTMDIWQHLNDDNVRSKLQPQFPSIGRLEVPLQTSIPYGGTGFVVGRNLLMTNRHVARLFSEGRGNRVIYYTGGAAIDFVRERNSLPKNSHSVNVLRVRMVHPYWDMALLEVEPTEKWPTPLVLSVRSPGELLDKEVVVVGYPAQDYRNDLAVQDRIFSGVYGVKRMQPGKLRPRAVVQSFESQVNAITHDSSTLGGNSGSVVLDVASGQAVALHFAGEYLKANYAVPMYELARDPRVVDAGLNFEGSVPPTSDFDDAWRSAGDESISSRNKFRIVPRPAPSPVRLTAGGAGVGAVSLSLPLNITISLGGAGIGATVSNVTKQAVAAADVAAADLVEKVPKIYPNLNARSGYDKNFLGFEVPIPNMTVQGEAAAVKLEDGSHLLNYEHFSLVLHKRRRLALFTASNVDWRSKRREVHGKKPSREKLNGFIGNEEEDWVIDPRIPLDYQLPDYFYVKDKGAFDRGHIVRRDDVAWGGSFKEMQMANGDTFHTTNCSPQVREFNQSRYGNFNWGQLENMVQQQTKTETVAVFAGPVLDPGDRHFHGLMKSGVEISVQIPERFWKMIVCKNGGHPAVFGFILDQDLLQVDLHAEFAVPDAWKRFLHSVEEIESLLFGLANLSWFKQWDQHNPVTGQ
jgi:endonuclease G